MLTWTITVSSSPETPPPPICKIPSERLNFGSQFAQTVNVKCKDSHSVKSRTAEQSRGHTCNQALRVGWSRAFSTSAFRSGCRLFADGDFFVLEGVDDWFIDGSWGWPSLFAADLPNGGPSYPLATPGARCCSLPKKIMASRSLFTNHRLALTADKFPASGRPGWSRVSTRRSTVLFAEGFYQYNQKQGLAGTIKLGGWNHFGTFEDQRFDVNGFPIALTGHPGRPIQGDWALYALFEQLIWRNPVPRRQKALPLFCPRNRCTLGAKPHRSLCRWRRHLHGCDPASPRRRTRPRPHLQRHLQTSSGSDQNADVSVVRKFELALEICHTAQLQRGWTLQPDFQYIVNPGGNVLNAEGTPVGNAVVLGVRTTITF